MNIDHGITAGGSQSFCDSDNAAQQADVFVKVTKKETSQRLDAETELRKLQMAVNRAKN